jgi:DNA-binding CsgD family transcriptional regulator
VRECRILDRIGRDRTHKDIAAELGVSINTVANLAAKAYRKLGRARRRGRGPRPSRRTSPFAHR